MKMSDVRVGMKLRLPQHFAGRRDIITVTELTERGFKYDLSEDANLFVMPMLTLERCGHEHYGYRGESIYEPVTEDRDDFELPDFEEMLVSQ